MNYQKLYEKHVIQAYEKQMKLYALTGDENWQLRLDDEALVFGKKRLKKGLTFDAHLIATESSVNDTWLWADANTQGFSDNLLKSVRKLRQFGKSKGYPYFDRDRFDLNEPEHLSQMLVVAIDYIIGASVSYACEHDEGCVHVALKDKRIDQQDDLDANALIIFASELSFSGIADSVKSLEYYALNKGLIKQRFDPNGETSFQIASGETVVVTQTPTDDGGKSVQFETRD